MPIDPSVWQNQRRGIQGEYNANAAVNNYSRFLTQQRGNRQLGDYQREWKRQVPQFTSSWGQRGMTGSGVRSGVYQNALNQYVTDYERNRARMTQDNAQELRQFDLTGGQLQAQRNQALWQLEADKAREIAQAAQHLQALKQYTGG